MNSIVLGRCTDCDSEYFFMDGSRCAVCLSALQTGAPDAVDAEPVSDIFFQDPEQERQLQRAA
jgi:hypothetical protein